MENVEILIVGGGLAGLAAAQQLKTAVSSLLVLEKASEVGGRLATMSLAGGRADAGAQFFTVRTAVFQAIVDDWLARDVVFEWSRGWTDGSAISDGQLDGYPRYAAQAGMQSLARELAQGVAVQTGVAVAQITADLAGWRLVAKNGRLYHSRYVILTPPLPQSLALLGKRPLAPDVQAALAQIQYAPCLAGLFHVVGEVHLPEPGGLQRPNHPYSWLANNQQKGISAVQLITVHASPAQSRALWSLSDAEALEALTAELRRFLGKGAQILAAELKRWPYASLDSVYAERFLQIEENLFLAGDGFGGPRVEGAVLSGLAVAEAIH